MYPLQHFMTQMTLNIKSSTKEAYHFLDHTNMAGEFNFKKYPNIVYIPQKQNGRKHTQKTYVLSFMSWGGETRLKSQFSSS